MNRSPLRTLCLLALLLAATAAERGTEVSAEVAALLRAAQDEAQPAEALRRLRAWKGEAHPLISLVIGQTAYRLAQQDPANAAAHRTLAADSFRLALAGDPQLRQAGLGLAQLAADRGDWAEAVSHLAQAVDARDASGAELLFYAQSAYHAKDWRLATTLIGQGIMRFPADTGFRRLELAMLLQAERPDEAAHAVRALLAQAPDTTDLWRNLAWAEQERGHDADALAALEAASLSKPGDRDLARRLGETQLARQLPQAAQETFQALIGTPPAAEALADARLMEIAARAASEAGDVTQARAWLAAVPADKRNRSQRLLAARLAVQAADPAAAEAALTDLVALGERDPAVLAWAGHLAEQRQDDARAEALYQQAAAGDGAAAGTATLRLAVLMHRQQRHDEASVLLASHLARHPDDQQALALRAAFAARQQEARR